MNNYRTEPESLVTSTNGINVELRKYFASGVAADMHIHSSIEALYFKSGTFEVVVNEESYIVCEGDLVLIRKYSVHSVNALSEDGGAYYVLKIHPSILEDFSTAENITIFQFFFSLDSKERRCIWHKEELMESGILLPLTEISEECCQEDIFSFTSLKLNAGKFLLAVMRDSYQRDPSYFQFLKFGGNIIMTVHKALEYINTNYASNVTTKDIAKEVNFSYAYFSNCFARITGMSLKQYLSRTRINHAKSELLNTSRSVSEIGQSVGYNSTSYFILAFHRQTGMTPLEFVKKHKNASL